jgi:DNA-binding NtrC family response regulator
MREILDQLVAEMVDKGIRFEDAQREFERRFISHVVRRADGNLGRAADALGVHRNTLTRKIKNLKMGPARRAGGAGAARR